MLLLSWLGNHESKRMCASTLTQGSLLATRTVVLESSALWRCSRRIFLWRRPMMIDCNA